MEEKKVDSEVKKLVLEEKHARGCWGYWYQNECGNIQWKEDMSRENQVQVKSEEKRIVEVAQVVFEEKPVRLEN